MIVKNHENIQFEIIIKCFLKSFEKYYVEFPTETGFLERKMSNCKDYNLSYEMFDKN